MRLSELKLKNFRCYNKETSFLIDDLTAIIGRNDIGKSTILEALDGFFNDKIDLSDLCNSNGSAQIELTCCFDDVPSQIILDTSVETSPIEEGILNKEKQLEIKKTFTFGVKKSVATSLVANYPSDERLKDILSMKNSKLKSYAEELGLDLSGINKSKNPPIRELIRNYIAGDKEIRVIKVDGNVDSEDNLKGIWSSLKKLLPVYSLFKVDRALDDKDGDIQDPMKVAINEALSLPEVQNLLEQVEIKVREASTEVAARTIEKLKDLDESISERLKSDFSKIPSYSKIFDLKLLNENGIPLNKRGSGIRRLVLLSFFQAQAETRKFTENAPSIIYAIEEPETSQHPDYQMLLIKSLIKLSENPDIQVLFSSHNANLVKEIPVQSLRYISRNEYGEVIIESGKNIADESNNEAVIEKIINTLGILPNPTDKIKVLVYVEGQNDYEALRRYSHKLNKHDPEILDLTATDQVAYVITGGSALKHYIEHKHLSGLGKPEVHIYDSDVKEYLKVVRDINGESNPKMKAFNTSKIELENYLHHEAIKECYADCGISGLKLKPITDHIKVPQIVAEKLYRHGGKDWSKLETEEKKEKASEKKKLLNTKAVEKMTIERIRERGGYEELREWFMTIKGFLD